MPDSILVIGDDVEVCDVLSAMLEADGYFVETVQNGRTAVDCLRNRHFDVALAELVMPEMDGIQTMAALRDLDANIQVIVLISYDGVDIASAALKRGACDYLQKPITEQQLHTAVVRAINARRLTASLSPDEAARALMEARQRQDLTISPFIKRKRAEAEMAARHRLATLVADVGVALTRADSLRQGLQECSEILVRNLGAAFARIWTLNEEENVLELQASAGMYTRLDGSHARVPMGKLKIGRIGESGEPHLTNSVREDSWVGDPEWARREGMVAFAGYPLKIEGRLMGVLAAFARHPLTEATLQAFASVADSIAQFIKHKRAEESLRESESRLRVITDSAQDAILMMDPQGRISHWNPAAERILGYTSAEAIGQDLHSLIVPPRYHEAHQAAFPAFRQTGQGPAVGKTLDLRARRKDGKEISVLLSLSATQINGAWHAVGILRDITEQKRAQEAARESEAKLQVIFDGVEAGIFLIDPETHQIVEANPVALKLVGAERDAVVGAVCHKFICPADCGRCPVTDLKQEVDNSERVLLTVLGERLPIIKTVKSVVIGGRPLLLESFVDISLRKQAEQELYQSRQMLQSILDNIPQRVFWKDRNVTYLGCNRAFAMDAGLQAPEEIIGKSDFELTWKDSAELYRVDDKRVMEQESARLNFEERQSKPDGSLLWLRTNKLPLRNREGKVVGIIGTYEDISEHKRAEEELRESNELVRLLLDSIPEAVYGIDMQGNCTFCNPSCLRITGYQEAAELHGKNMHDMIHHTRQDGTRYPVENCHIFEAFRGGYGTHIADEVLWRRDGSNFPAEYWSLPIRRQGIVIGTVVTFVDITERKRAEEELAFKTALLEAEAKATIDGILVVDRTGHVLQVNERFAELWNLPEDIFNTNDDKKVLEHVLGQVKDHGAFQERVNYLYAHESERSQEEIEIKDGRFFDRYTAPLEDATGKHYGRIWYFRDITERKQAEADLLRYAHDQEAAKNAQEENSAQLAHLVEELAHERDLLGTLMDNVPDAIYFKDSQSRFTRINASQARILGVADSRAALGKTDYDFFPREDAQAYYAAEQKIIASGEPVIGALKQHSAASGKSQWFSNTEVPVKDAQGRVTGIVGVGRDVTEWKSTLEAFRESEERYRELFENASDIVYTTGFDARFTSLNRAGQQIFGYSAEEATQLCLRQVVAPRHWEIVERGRARLLAGETAVTMEVEVTAKDGHQIMLEVKPRQIFKDGKPIGVQGIARNITGRDEAEMELRHAQKLESVGRLASGIAHEINTPIQFVGDNTRFLQSSFACFLSLLRKYQELHSALASGAASPQLLAEVQRVEEESDCSYLMAEVPQALTQTLEGVDRVATIVRAMKEFAHPEGKEMAAADLNRALLSTLTVARNELKYVADVETEFGDLPLVICNIGDLNQVFLNLLVNAAHAIEESTKGSGQKGKIRVRTLSEGGTVLITITDTGGGIPEAIRGRIFDPFFTTKEVGRGTGQGLAIARSVVVERHKRDLTFESEVGKGTAFYVRLPIDPGECTKEVRVI